MGATKRDTSGVFAGGLQTPGRVSSLSPNGITFQTPQYLPQWTEVGVLMRLPGAGRQAHRPVDCRGVVVQCAKRAAGEGFEVSLLFLDLPKRAAARLATGARTAAPTSLSIVR